MLKPKFQIIKFTVNNPNEKITIDEPTKLDHKEVTGLLFSATNRDAARNSQVKISIDGEEILPQGFEVSLLLKGRNISLNDAKHSFTEKAQNSAVKGEYTDGGSILGSYPYDVRIYLFTNKEDGNA